MLKAKNFIAVFAVLAIFSSVFVGCKSDDEEGGGNTVPVLSKISLDSLRKEIVKGEGAAQETYLSLNLPYKIEPIFTPSNVTNKGFTISIEGDPEAKACIAVDNEEKTIVANSELPSEKTISIKITAASNEKITDIIENVTVKTVPLESIAFPTTAKAIIYTGREYSLQSEYMPVFSPEYTSFKNFTYSIAEKLYDGSTATETAASAYVTYEEETKTIKALQKTEGKKFVLIATSDQKDSNNQNIKAELQIEVQDVLPTKMTLKKTSFKIASDGATVIVPVFEPEDTTDKTAKFEITSGESVTVDANTGVVTAVAEKSGATTIKVTSNANSSLTATATVTVASFEGNAYVIEEDDTMLGYVNCQPAGAKKGHMASNDYRTGSKGSGYIDNPEVIIYSIYSAKAQDVKASIRYAYFGNTFDLRAGNVIVNGAQQGIFYCNFTNNKGKYAGESVEVWQDSNEVTIHLDAGENQIRLEPVAKGTELQKASEHEGVGAKYPTKVLKEGEEAESQTNEERAGDNAWKADGNFAWVDSLTLVGTGLGGGGNSLMFYSVATSVDEKYGTITVTPDQASYKEGTTVTVTCTPKSGYKFDSWYEAHSVQNPAGSNSATYTLTVGRDFNLKAHVIPDSYNAETANAGIDGYATVCDDNGTKYTITGGAGGETITIGSYADLITNKPKLSSNDPYIVKITARIESPNTPTSSATVEKFDVGSNKTIIGEGGTRTDKTKWPGLKGIYFNVYNCENVIVKNLVFGEVLFKDAFAVHTAQFIWIDHCLFYSIDQSDKDKYDGLLDIKNGTRYMTISNCEFKDHWKAILCGSSDVTENGDTKMRLTFFGNKFYNVGSRLPLFRYGKLHMYNNYFDGAGRSDASCVNMRKGSEGLIEYNYFANAKMAIGYYYDESGGSTGYWNVRGNVYKNVVRDTPTISTTSWTPCYTVTPETNMETVKNNAIANSGPKFN